MTHRLFAIVLSGMLVVGVAGCDVRTATAPGGDLTLTARFDDVEDLTTGHNVQASNVVVGSVRGIELDGHRARVTMSIVDGRRIPDATRAVIRHTSVLGEAYVDLVFPAGFDPETGPFLADDGEITDTDTQDGIEQLAQEAAGLISALSGSDIGAVVQAGATALDGRGHKLNALVRDAAAVVDTVAAQSGDLTAVIDGLSRLGSALAADDSEIGRLLDQLSTATSATAASRDRIVRAVEALIGLAAATNDTVLVPHAERLRSLLGELNPLLGYFAERTDVLERLITDLLRFTEKFPSAIHNGQILLLSWAYLDPDTVLEAPTGQMPLEALEELVGGSAAGGGGA